MIDKEETMGELAQYEQSDKDRIKEWAGAGTTALAIRHRLVRLHDYEDDYMPPSVEEINKIINEEA